MATGNDTRTFTPSQLAAQFEIRLSAAPEPEHAAMLMELSDDVLGELHRTYAISGLRFGAGDRLLSRIRAEIERRGAVRRAREVTR